MQHKQAIPKIIIAEGYNISPLQKCSPGLFHSTTVLNLFNESSGEHFCFTYSAEWHKCERLPDLFHNMGATTESACE